MKLKGIRAAFLIPFCIALTFLIYYYAYFSPVQEEILTADRDISALQASMAIVRNKSGELDSTNASMASLESWIQNKKDSLPEHLGPYDIILLLSEIDQSTLAKNSLIFLEPIEREDYTILPVRFHFASDYNGLMKLLTFLESLDTRPSVSNMQISASFAEENPLNPMEGSGKVIYNLDVEMTLNFYMRN